MRFGVYAEGKQVQHIDVDGDNLTYAEFLELEKTAAQRGLKVIKLNGNEVAPNDPRVQQLIGALKAKGIAVRVAGQDAQPGMSIPAGGVIVGVGEQKGGKVEMYATA